MNEGHQQALDILSQLNANGVSVNGLNQDSRKLLPGEIFLAIPGKKVDGRTFIARAVTKGAAAIISEAGWEGVSDFAIPVIEASRLAWISGWLAGEVYKHPSKKIPVIAVTGTSGKTSVTQWAAQLVSKYQGKAMTVGTLGAGFSGKIQALDNTTPDAPTLQRLLYDYIQQGAEVCLMEASSIGLSEGRCNGIYFDTAVLTNLKRDHLDFHGSIESYAKAKEILFTWPGLKTAVINLDDDYGKYLACISSAEKKIGYSCSESVSFDSSYVDVLLQAKNLSENQNGLSFLLVLYSKNIYEEFFVQSNLRGSHNVENMLAVASIAFHLRIPFAQIAASLVELSPIAGRMEAINPGQNEPLLVVDYAHKPDALENVLMALRVTAQERNGQLFCLFGCGGDRDRGKRSLMGEIAANLANVVYLTDDNPRYENPKKIIDEIVQGINNPIIIYDRRQAINTAVENCQQNDVLLIAGKGHETYQEIAGEKYPFSDFDVACQALTLWRDKHGVV